MPIPQRFRDSGMPVSGGSCGTAGTVAAGRPPGGRVSPAIRSRNSGHATTGSCASSVRPWPSGSFRLVRVPLGGELTVDPVGDRFGLNAFRRWSDLDNSRTSNLRCSRYMSTVMASMVNHPLVSVTLCQAIGCSRPLFKKLSVHFLACWSGLFSPSGLRASKLTCNR